MLSESPDESDGPPRSASPPCCKWLTSEVKARDCSRTAVARTEPGSSISSACSWVVSWESNPTASIEAFGTVEVAPNAADAPWRTLGGDPNICATPAAEGTNGRPVLIGIWLGLTGGTEAFAIISCFILCWDSCMSTICSDSLGRASINPWICSAKTAVVTRFGLSPPGGSFTVFFLPPRGVSGTFSSASRTSAAE